MQPGKHEEAEIDKRLAQFTGQSSIRDVYDALRELITNSDDSYHELFERRRAPHDGGSIVIEIERGSRGRPSLLIVKDRAEGMTLDEMRLKLKTIGRRTSGRGARGFMARGGRDCAALGNMVFESIKGGLYHKCEWLSTWEFVPWEASPRHPSPKATQNEQNRLGIRKGGAGTCVTLELAKTTAKGSKASLPQFDTLLNRLILYWPLRCILGEGSQSEVHLRDRRSGRMERVMYRRPAAEKVIDREKYTIPDYPGCYARLTLYRAPESLEDLSDRFRHSGVAIRGSRGVHECSLLAPDLESDPLAKRYFGWIECEDIDRICDEYDQMRADGRREDSNPMLLLDPERRTGLVREHPFANGLLQLPIERLRALVAKDREKERSAKGDVTSKEMEQRLGRLAKAAGRFLRQQMDDLEELAEGEEVEIGEYAKHGVALIPKYANIPLGKERNLTLYVKRALLNGTVPTFTVAIDNDAAVAESTTVDLRQHRSRDDCLVGTLRLRGATVASAIVVSASSEGLPTADAMVSVVEEQEVHDFVEPLEFEHVTYNVREGKQRTLHLYARYPELVSGEVEVSVLSTDNDSLPVRGRTVLNHIPGTNYAVGDVVVRARRLADKSITVKARINEAIAEAKVKVVQKDENGIAIEIKLRDEDYGSFRSKWGDHEGKPNWLLISTRHPSIARYLGPADEYRGQDTPHFCVLLAEIVADAVCRKSLVMEARERSWEFGWADLSDNDLIVDDVIAQLQRRLKAFTAESHRIMLSDALARNLVSEDGSSIPS